MCFTLFLEFLFTTFFVCRMTKLLDDEVEEDEQFWNQEALKEVCFLYIYHIHTFLKRWEWALLVDVKIYNGTIRFIDEGGDKIPLQKFSYVCCQFISLSIFAICRKNMMMNTKQKVKLLMSLTATSMTMYFYVLLVYSVLIHQAIAQIPIFLKFISFAYCLRIGAWAWCSSWKWKRREVCNFSKLVLWWLLCISFNFVTIVHIVAGICQRSGWFTLGKLLQRKRRRRRR